MYWYPYDYARVMNDPKLIADVAKAINGEYSAIQCYERLAKQAPNEEERKQILEIRDDEIRHFHVFTQMYTSLTGKQANPQWTEACPEGYLEGLHAAIQDEQRTVDFYNGVADRASDPHIKETFRRTAADEQNHAVWFLYYLTIRLQKRSSLTNVPHI